MQSISHHPQTDCAHKVVRIGHNSIDCRLVWTEAPSAAATHLPVTLLVVVGTHTMVMTTESDVAAVHD